MIASVDDTTGVDTADLNYAVYPAGLGRNYAVRSILLEVSQSALICSQATVLVRFHYLKWNAKSCVASGTSIVRACRRRTRLAAYLMER